MSFGLRPTFLVFVVCAAFGLAALPGQALAQGAKSGASVAPDAVLYDFSNLQTGTANGANGANTSVIATGDTTYGFGANGTASPQVILGDRFTLTSASTISSIVFYAYSTSTYPSPPTSPFTGATVSIWNAAPGTSGATVLATSTTLGGTAWTGMYRVTSTALTGATRPIFSLTSTFPNTSLAAGNYWATITITGIVSPGTSTSGFIPPVVMSNATSPTSYPNGGAAASVQSTDGGATWTAPADATSGTRPFVPMVVNGTAAASGPVSIGGRVSTTSGAGIKNVVVRITGGSLTSPATALTGPFGYYSVPNLTAGQTYTVTILSKSYTFTSSTATVTPNASVSNVDFVSQQ